MKKFLISAERTQRFHKVFEAATAGEAELRAQAELDENGMNTNPTAKAGWDKDDEQSDEIIILEDNTTEVA